ncbi:MAG: hypothetical protein OEV30_11800 [Ignavibacteria bacterium]|nr:hypothetical protein [Ignavibacteria bacterium]
MNTSYDARKLRAVGLYVMPSKSPDDDQLLSNVFALDLLSRGYRVIDMNRIAAEQGVQVDASDHGDVMDFLASVGLSQSPDVILVARPVWTGVVLAWKSDPRMATFRLRNYGVFKGLDLDVGMFDVASRDTVLAVSLRDTARILRDNKTFRDYEEPTRYGLGWERWDREGPFH